MKYNVSDRVMAPSTGDRGTIVEIVEGAGPYLLVEWEQAGLSL